MMDDFTILLVKIGVVGLVVSLIVIKISDLSHIRNHKTHSTQRHKMDEIDTDTQKAFDWWFNNEINKLVKEKLMKSNNEEGKNESNY